MKNTPTTKTPEWNITIFFASINDIKSKYNLWVYEKQVNNSYADCCMSI